MRTIVRIGVNGAVAVSVTLAVACGQTAPADCGPPPAPRAVVESSAPAESINLADRLTAGRLRIVNRRVGVLDGGTGLRVSAAPDIGLVWIEGTDLGEGTIDADVCGRDVDSASFLGVAFHRKDDAAFEAVYLRPFNFRARTTERRGHAVQYIRMPDSDFAQLRRASPEEFENPVDASVVPTGWIALRVVIRNARVRVFVGERAVPALDVRALPAAAHGQVGLYVDNNSDGVFANVRVVHGF